MDDKEVIKFSISKWIEENEMEITPSHKPLSRIGEKTINVLPKYDLGEWAWLNGGKRYCEIIISQYNTGRIENEINWFFDNAVSCSTGWNDHATKEATIGAEQFKMALSCLGKPEIMRRLLKIYRKL